MALFDFFKKNKEKERFLKKSSKREASAKKSGLLQNETKKEKNKDKQNLKFSEDTIILKNPYITEKSMSKNEKGVYTFKIGSDANKIMVKRAVEKMYNTKVDKVNIGKIPAKKIFVRGKWGKKTGYKKAVVYLKKGEKIEI